MNIYVGNLPGDVTEEDLQKVFDTFGQVTSVSIIKDRFSGEPRGFGFVEMPSREQAQNAIQQADGMDLKGKPMRVNEARSKEKGRDRRGGGRGGYGSGSGKGRGGSRNGPRSGPRRR